MFSDVFVMCFTARFMQWNKLAFGCINPIYMFTLQYVYLRRINCALCEWVSFNDHPFLVKLSTNWSRNQMWWNGMNACNPLDDGTEDVTFYGEDPWKSLLGLV